MSEDAVPEVDVHEAARRMQSGELLFDVREPEEYADVHAQGAQLIPLSDLTSRVDEIPLDRPILIICQAGARSERAAEWLNDRGASATNVGGGTRAWVEAGLPSVSGPAH